MGEKETRTQIFAKSKWHRVCDLIRNILTVVKLDLLKFVSFGCE